MAHKESSRRTEQGTSYTSSRGSLAKKSSPPLEVSFGEWVSADLQKSGGIKKEEVIFLVPFFKGKKSNVKRHAQFYSELGFDVFLFDLKSFPDWKHPQTWKNLVSKDFQCGVKHVWADQILDYWDQIRRPLIVHSLSNPTAAVIEAIARKKSEHNIKALIADCGPAGELWKSMDNYFTSEEPVSLEKLRHLVATVTTQVWSLGGSYSLIQDLRKLPQDLKILSIRGWQDNLIPPSSIDLCLEQARHVQEIQILDLPQGGHLDGIKKCPELYRQGIKSFLGNL